MSVAALNSPTSTVIAGQVAAVEEFVTSCDSDGVFARIIPVDYAAHAAPVSRCATR